MTRGLHHITSLTADVQANVDFYAGFLGLSLVKQTAGFEDGEQLHLFYGDPTGAPGTLISFLVWPNAGRGRTGIGQVSEIALAVPPESLGEWLTRALANGIAVEGPKKEFSQTVLRLKDPDGLIVKLVADAGPCPRLFGATLLTDKPEETAAFVARFGYAEAERDGLTLRMRSESDVIDIRAVTGYVPSIAGAGVPDHLAFRATDAEDLARMRLSLKNEAPTVVHDRKYFLSMYVREPAGTLIEFATDAPGMGVDEPMDALGRELKIPPQDMARADELRVVLPQFARPGEPRPPRRELPYVHRLYIPEDADGSTLVMLHASGGSETDLMPFAQQINPRATILAARGRALEEGKPRWFRREGFAVFDQADIRSEAEAFEAFLEGAIRGYGLDREKMTLVGHSNGANFAAAFLRLKPEAAPQAILMRAQEVLEAVPENDLSQTRVLLIEGTQDLLVKMAKPLQLPNAERVENATGHELNAEDRRIAREWLALG